MNVMNRSEKVHNVPVPERFLPLVHRVLAEAYATEPTSDVSMVDAPQQAAYDDGISYEWTEEEIVRAYRESSSTLRVIFDYLTDQAPHEVTAPDLARVAFPQASNAENKLYGVFGGMGRRFHNKYRKHWFFYYGREHKPDGSLGSMVYSMTPEQAAWVKKASGRE
jgi:hypothetical protein